VIGPIEPSRNRVGAWGAGRGNRKSASPSFLTPSLCAEAYAVAQSEVIRMAIQEYVRSIAATESVSKEEVFRFLEMQFARADRNHDGLLEIDELAVFAQSVYCPEADQR
jgi:hypothetical protein